MPSLPSPVAGAFSASLTLAAAATSSSALFSDQPNQQAVISWLLYRSVSGPASASLGVSATLYGYLLSATSAAGYFGSSVHSLGSLAHATTGQAEAVATIAARGWPYLAGAISVSNVNTDSTAAVTAWFRPFEPTV